MHGSAEELRRCALIPCGLLEVALFDQPEFLYHGG